MRSVLVVGLAIAAGVACKKEAAAPGAGGSLSTQDQDALWALAPEAAKVGFVASPRGVAMIERGAIAVEALLEAAPELAAIRDELRRALTRAGSSRARLSELGFGPDKGFAIFLLDKDEIVAVLPVADRGKFLAKVNGKKGAEHDELDGGACKSINDRYVCASSAALFAGLGKGGLDATRRATLARGDLEFAGHRFTRPEDPSVAVVAQLEPGVIILRGAVARVPGNVIEWFGTASRPRTGSATASGFGTIDLAPYLAKLPPLPIAPSTTLADLGKSVAGPATFVISAGTNDPDLRLPLRDPAPMKVLIEHCAQLPPLAAAGATVKDGVCHVPLPQIQLALDAWIDGSELHIGNRAAGPAVSLVPSALADELARGEWAIGFFGRGAYLDLTSSPQVDALLRTIPSEARMLLRAAPLLNEVGVGVRRDADVLHFVVGVRTAWANPDEIVQKLLAISSDQIMSGQATQIGKSVAAAAPSSLFAQDLKAGHGGVMSLTMPTGVLAAVAIPAFMDYMKRSKKTEAALELNKIAKAARIAFVEHGEFPKGNMALTPPTPCCSGPGHRCEVDAAVWEQAPWKALDFQIVGPSLFQYSYESDGKTFLAKAVGDLDCDGIMITYELRGAAENGQPTVQLTEPARDAD